jgi:hypothetical protein
VNERVYYECEYHCTKLKLNSVASVRKRTIPTERNTAVLDQFLFDYPIRTGRAMTQAAVWVRARVRSCRLCGGQNYMGTGFLGVFRFPLLVLIP